MTVQFDSLAIRIGETGMKIAASNELTARTFMCKFVNTYSAQKLQTTPFSS